MAKANEKRIAVTLECTTCKRRNYITTKNKVNDRERIEIVMLTQPVGQRLGDAAITLEYLGRSRSQQFQLVGMVLGLLAPFVEAGRRRLRPRRCLVAAHVTIDAPEAGADQRERPVRVAGGEADRVAHLGEHLAFHRAGVRRVASLDGVGDHGAQLLGDVVALVGRDPPDDLVHVALGEGVRAHCSSFVSREIEATRSCHSSTSPARTREPSGLTR